MYPYDDVVDRGCAAMGAILLATVCGSVWGIIGLAVGYAIWG